MTLEEYMEELEFIERQYGGEEALYPLINSLLRESGSFSPLNKQAPSLVDVHRGRLCKYASRNLLYGISNYPDMVIMSKDFEYIDNEFNYSKGYDKSDKNDEYGKKIVYIRNKKSKLRGCIEVKYLTEKIEEINKENQKPISVKLELEYSDGDFFIEIDNDNDKTKVDQLYGDVLWYGKVIHTNGKIWNYYEIEDLDKINNYLMYYYFDFMKNRYKGNAEIVKAFYECPDLSKIKRLDKITAKIKKKTIVKLEKNDEQVWDNLKKFFEEKYW
ncbi:MAG: hypothetical protein IJ661_02110 [Lachnospiraceae bacterium]|nr:hypothetical protein [Lachnospiraceae bacterium]